MAGLVGDGLAIAQETILIVEDHAAMRRVLRDWLHIHLPQYGVTEAASGEEAVQLVRVVWPAAVVMDIGLPGMNGLEATSHIKQVAPRVPVIVLTVGEEEAYRVHAAAVGADAYVLKRLMAVDLLAALRMVLPVPA